jgi:hypothetical protein
MCLPVNKLNGVLLDYFLQKAILRMANVDLSAIPPNLSIEGVQGFVNVDVTHAADNFSRFTSRFNRDASHEQVAA